MKIKMRLFVSLFVVFAILLCFAVFFVQSYNVVNAEQNENNQETATERHSHCFCGGNIDVGDHAEHQSVTYMPWNGGDFDYDGEGGSIGVAYLYLTDDVVDNIKSCNRTDGEGILSVKEGQTLYLCLNGHSLKNGNRGSNVIDIYGELYLCDCMSGGTIGGRTNGANSGAVWLGNNGKFYMYGGSLTGSYGLKNGGGLYAKNNSQIKMYGGSIVGNRVTRQSGGVYLTEKSSMIMYDGVVSDNSATDFGGGVIVDDGTTFIMNGGVIENNSSGNNGGGVFVSGGTFIMNGGTIRGNTAANGGGVCMTYDNGRGMFEMNGGTITGNAAFGNGGGVYVWSKATFNMKGGVIFDNEATYGGGICLYSANEDKNKTEGVDKNNVWRVSCGQVVGNTATGFGSGVCCFQYSVLEFCKTDKIIVDGNDKTNLYFADKYSLTIEGLAEGSKIGVSLLNAPTKEKPFTIYDTSNVDLGNYFFSDSDDCLIKSAENGIVLTADIFTARIKYDTGCEQSLPTQIEKGFDETMVLKVFDEQPSMPCRRFLGWATNDDLQKVKYNAGDDIEVNGEVTLYAVWTDAAHNLSSVAEVAATCEHDGAKSYFACSECGKKFADVEAMQEITSDNQLVVAGGHKFGAWQETVEPTTESVGMIAHRDCERCGKHFDANGTEIDDLTIAKLPDDDAKEDSSSNINAVGVTVGITAASIFALEALACVAYRIVIKKRRI